MCSGKALTPPDSFAASRSANAHPVLLPKTGALAACLVHGGTTRLFVRKNREYAMSPEIRTYENPDGGRIRGTVC